ncbi:response regulator [Roseisolibacter sp. H3M3-2]|uniref:response regulator n=1 Tax=Roseisolibacter sp. H3M3-2 TaxID=3031323 RepID=UPI0023D9D4E7|nr:response regulator [Roseisolibacter sp. H3M3-2]MDF1502582.1 response regulator [Roseisolibacter sp. H3M3-2]
MTERTPPTRLLVVEDTREIAEALQDSLEAEGYEVALATKAAHALALATSHRPALVLLDLGLPDRDGYEVLRELRARGSDVPVLILSARREEADKLQGFRLGADDYVTKPFSRPELLARLEALLKRAARGGAAPPAEAAPAPVGTRLSDDDMRAKFGLTPRQLDVAKLLAEGRTNQEIAEALGTSFYTARNHAEQVLRRLGVASRAAVGAVFYGA